MIDFKITFQDDELPNDEFDFKNHVQKLSTTI